MNSNAARWCNACLRPIEEADRHLVYVFMNDGSGYRDVVVHAACYDAGDPRSTASLPPPPEQGARHP